MTSGDVISLDGNGHGPNGHGTIARITEADIQRIAGELIAQLDFLPQENAQALRLEIIGRIVQHGKPHSFIGGVDGQQSVNVVAPDGNHQNGNGTHPTGIVAREPGPFHKIKAGGYDLEFYPDVNKVYVDGNKIGLTPRETELLELLARKNGGVLKFSEYEEETGYGTGGLLKKWVQRLRRKVGEEFIMNIHGVGYRLATDNSAIHAPNDSGEINYEPNPDVVTLGGGRFMLDKVEGILYERRDGVNIPGRGVVDRAYVPINIIPHGEIDLLLILASGVHQTRTNPYHPFGLLEPYKNGDH